MLSLQFIFILSFFYVIPLSASNPLHYPEIQNIKKKQKKKNKAFLFKSFQFICAFLLKLRQTMADTEFNV